ncbi:MAG TPA: diacylglycerol kinase family lipid kinase [Oscillospiraceae bacterium]|mgnify:CR=1 FL=1|nr:diacylglycerol kinase family lipid kinase [Oscillospiraceae bacterium]HPK36069.1 diacylglycerol kinase family lipid kinase [Oscillospiraceae bacterium]HPR76588.1 diacylglycerol kinase family lipid kinase [Oscillospiraceae bacterium]
MDCANKKLLLIVNPTAGRMRVVRYIGKIKKILSDGGYSVSVHMTSARAEATRLLAASAGDYDVIGCCGGDGTLNEVISGVLLSGKDVPIGYIPSGTTNDLAKSLGLSTSIIKATLNLLTGEPYFEDIGKFQDRYFTYVASFGAFTRVSYETPQKDKNLFGHAAYLMGGLCSIGDIKPFRVKVTCDGNVSEGDFIFGAVTNSTSVGGVMRLSDDQVNLRDGKFEVMLIRNPENAAQIGQLIDETVNRHYDGKLIALHHASEIRFESQTPLAWTLDGESGGEYTDCKAVNLHHAVRLILPR